MADVAPGAESTRATGPQMRAICGPLLISTDLGNADLGRWRSPADSGSPSPPGTSLHGRSHCSVRVAGRLASGPCRDWSPLAMDIRTLVRSATGRAIEDASRRYTQTLADLREARRRYVDAQVPIEGTD